MKTFWENDGEPNDKGEYWAVIDLEDGSGAQRFSGATHLDVANKLMQAQANASIKIRELVASQTPEVAPVISMPKRRDLSADERFTLSQDMNDPNRAPEAIKTVIEAEVGVPLAKLSEKIQEDAEAEQDAYVRNEAKAFAESTPDYIMCSHNGTTIARYMQNEGMSPTRKNFALAFEKLKAVGLMVMEKPEQKEEPKPGTEGKPDGLSEPPTPGTRPRMVASTGIRTEDFGTEANANRKAQKYTRQQIEAMSIAEYKDKYENEPGFRQFVDTLMNQPASARG
jgi:hypothetical protein